MHAHSRRLTAILGTALLLAGCAGPAEPSTDAAGSPSASPTASESRTPVLDPPPEDAWVAGALSRAVIPVPRGWVSPPGGSAAARTGPFTLRRYVDDFLGGRRTALEDLRLGRLRRGYHLYAASGPDQWMHVYLFEARENYGALTFRNMLFGSRSRTTRPYEVRRIDEAVGQLTTNSGENGEYTTVKIAFVTGSVYAEVMVSARGGRPDTRLAERLAVAQKQRLRASLAPMA